jgi:flavin reductase (DIM6/NTAB) family NADH-FMN oxidoreductase RutF
METDLTKLTPRDAYALLISVILPRPIAWVSTVSADGRGNLAPFSFFQGVTANPPTLLFVAANTREGAKKDTLRNIEATGEFTVNLVPYSLAEAMNATSASLPHGESEFERFGIRAVPAARVRPPRVADSPVSLECVLDRIVSVGEGPLAGNVIFGRILHAHVDDAVLGADGRPDPAKLDLIGRLGGEGYVRTRERFDLRRPA